MSAIPTIALFALRESVRRRVFVVVGVLTVVFLALYGLGAWQAFKEVDASLGGDIGVDPKAVAGATLLGLAMFGTLFLGTILAVFLTLGAVRGDAEQGLLQPMLVRPLTRRSLLIARYLGAAAVCAIYVAIVFLIAAWLTNLVGGWSPDRLLEPALGLAAAVALLSAIALAGSVFLASTANGIAVFMVFGAGLVAGLLGQIGEALSSDTLTRIAEISTWVLPFEALYQDGLSALTADTRGFTRLAVDLGPFGGAQSAGWELWLWAIGFLGLVGAAAFSGFDRRDL